MKLTNNDLILFKYLFENNFLTRDHIHNYIWDNLNNKYIYHRLLQLKEKGFIETVDDPIPYNNRKTLVLGKEKAIYYMDMYVEKLKKLKRNDNFEFRYIKPSLYTEQKDLDYRQIKHDYFLNELRFILEDYGANKWYSDTLIYRQKLFSKIPDGLFENEYFGKEKTFAIELERTLKQDYRYREIFKRYSQEKEIDYVIYVTIGEDTDVIYDSLKNKKFKSKFMEKEIDKDEVSEDFYNKFYLTKYKHLKNGELDKVMNYAAKKKLDLFEAFKN